MIKVKYILINQVISEDVISIYLRNDCCMPMLKQQQLQALYIQINNSINIIFQISFNYWLMD